MMEAQKYRGGGKGAWKFGARKFGARKFGAGNSEPEILGQECQAVQYSLIWQEVDQLDKQVSSTAVVADVF